jgi:hypothetical protein
MSNLIAETNGSAIKNLDKVSIVNPESLDQAQARVKETKKSQKPAHKLVESIAIQEVYVEKYNCILRYDDTKIFIMEPKGDKQLLLGSMTEKGVDRNTALSASVQIMDLIVVANRKFSPVSKAQQEERKIEQMNIARAAIAALF